MERQEVDKIKLVTTNEEYLIAGDEAVAQVIQALSTEGRYAVIEYRGLKVVLNQDHIIHIDMWRDAVLDKEKWGWDVG